jgi:hypothetical protein
MEVFKNFTRIYRAFLPLIYSHALFEAHIKCLNLHDFTVVDNLEFYKYFYASFYIIKLQIQLFLNH